MNVPTTTRPTSISPLAGASAGLEAPWSERLVRDARVAHQHQPPALRAVTESVLACAQDSGALSFALTGSTALDRRTSVSDLDFYVVGSRHALPESDEELDLYAIELDDFQKALIEGDDYVHWTLRFGLILYDSGPLEWAHETARRENLWPDPAPKARQALRALGLAHAVTMSGDHGAAVEQARIAFSLAARWWLIAHNVFPRARRDLPEQLSWTPLAWVGEALWKTIFDDPSDDALMKQIARLSRLLQEETGLP